LAAEGATVALTACTTEPDPKHQGSLRQTLDEITGTGGASGDPPDAPPLFVMLQVDGSCCSTATTPDLKPLLLNAFRNAAAIMAQLHRIEPGAVGSVGRDHPQ
jgi:hypothetical protein